MYLGGYKQSTDHKGRTMTPRLKIQQSITTVIPGAAERSEDQGAKQGVSDHQLVQQLYKRMGSWAAVADALGRSPAFWWKVAHCKIKTPLPEDIRRHLVSSDPQLLRMILETVVPWLSSRERGAEERLRTNFQARDREQMA